MIPVSEKELSYTSINHFSIFLASSSTVHLKPISSVVASIIVIFGVACFGISKILCSPRVVNGKNQI